MGLSRIVYFCYRTGWVNPLNCHLGLWLRVRNRTSLLLSIGFSRPDFGCLASSDCFFQRTTTSLTNEQLAVGASLSVEPLNTEIKTQHKLRGVVIGSGFDPDSYASTQKLAIPFGHCCAICLPYFIRPSDQLPVFPSCQASCLITGNHRGYGDFIH